MPLLVNVILFLIIAALFLQAVAFGYSKNKAKKFVVISVSSRSFCKRGHNGLFKILGGRHVVWACEA